MLHGQRVLHPKPCLRQPRRGAEWSASRSPGVSFARETGRTSHCSPSRSLSSPPACSLFTADPSGGDSAALPGQPGRLHDDGPRHHGHQGAGLRAVFGHRGARRGAATRGSYQTATAGQLRSCSTACQSSSSPCSVGSPPSAARSWAGWCWPGSRCWRTTSPSLGFLGDPRTRPDRDHPDRDSPMVSCSWSPTPGRGADGGARAGRTTTQSRCVPRSSASASRSSTAAPDSPSTEPAGRSTVLDPVTVPRDRTARAQAARPCGLATAASRCLHGSTSWCTPGAARRPARPERGWEEHHPSRPSAASSRPTEREHPHGGGRRHRCPAPRRSPPPRVSARSRGPGHLPEPDGRREPRIFSYGGALRDVRSAAFELLPRLGGAAQGGRTYLGGEQQMLALARARDRPALATTGRALDGACPTTSSRICTGRSLADEQRRVRACRRTVCQVRARRGGQVAVMVNGEIRAAGAPG